MAEVADQHKEKRVELVLQQLEELPTLPTVALKVLEVTSSDESSSREVIGLIASDPALTARILKLVNSAAVSARNEVSSVDRAVVLLGFEAVRSAVLAVSLFQTFGEVQPRSPREAAEVAARAKQGGAFFAREAFWRHSIAVATAAELLARHLQSVWGAIGAGADRIDPSEAFVCGLLHDIGKVALDACLPKSFAKVIEASEMLRGNIADLERQIIGLDHMVVGKRLAEHWKLPANIRDCAWLHGQMPGALPTTVRNPRLVNLVTLADILVREQHLGFSGNHAFPLSRQSLLEAIGLDDASVTKVLSGLVSAIEVKAAALGLGEASTGELYQHAIRQANRELGRVSTQLAAKNRKLAVRAKFFDALAEFHGALRPDASPSLVLTALAETAIEALDVGSAAAFSVPPGQTYAEAVVVTKDGDPETILCDCPVRPEVASAPGTLLVAGSELEFAMGALSPKLGGGRRHWIPLMADGLCVGGVLWGAVGSDGEEADRLAGMRSELTGLASGWALALRTSQVRDEARLLSEQLAEANRNLQDAQTEVMRARTLVTISEMAAGAAHEMNNPLAVISGRSQLLASTLTDEKARKSAQLIVEQSHRLSGMITELMEFAKPDAPQPVSSDVGEILRMAVEEAKGRPGQADRNIDVAAFDVPAVRVDPGQVGRAIAEILDNALQATESGGQVTLTAAHDPFGGHVVITVADDGMGMDEHTLRRAFDPFFSSKAAGRRRGMGLAKAQRWVEAAGGSIRIDSRPGGGAGGGTRVLVLLPIERSGGTGSHHSATSGAAGMVAAGTVGGTVGGAGGAAARRVAV